MLLLGGLVNLTSERNERTGPRLFALYLGGAVCPPSLVGVYMHRHTVPDSHQPAAVDYADCNGVAVWFFPSPWSPCLSLSTLTTAWQEVVRVGFAVGFDNPEPVTVVIDTPLCPRSADGGPGVDSQLAQDGVDGRHAANQLVSFER